MFFFLHRLVNNKCATKIVHCPQTHTGFLGFEYVNELEYCVVSGFQKSSPSSQSGLSVSVFFSFLCIRVRSTNLTTDQLVHYTLTVKWSWPNYRIIPEHIPVHTHGRTCAYRQLQLQRHLNKVLQNGQKQRATQQPLQNS